MVEGAQQEARKGRESVVRSCLGKKLWSVQVCPVDKGLEIGHNKIKNNSHLFPGSWAPVTSFLQTSHQLWGLDRIIKLRTKSWASFRRASSQPVALLTTRGRQHARMHPVAGRSSPRWCQHTTSALPFPLREEARTVPEAGLMLFKKP